MGVSQLIPVTEIVARTAIVLLALVVGVRLFGERHTGELNLYDILMILIMSNAVQNSMTKGIGPLSVALASSGTLLVLGWLTGKLIARHPKLEKRFMGSPLVVVHEGQMLWQNLRHEGITEGEVMMEVRKQGLADLADVKLAVLEMDGSVSVVPKENSREG